MPAIECHTTLKHTDFIMRNHRVHDVSVMPGVTFLDLVFRTLMATGRDPGEIVLREVLFTEAIVTKPEADREIRVTVEGEDVRAESRWSRDGTPLSGWRRNLTGKVGTPSGPEPGPIDLDALRRGARRQGDMEDLYARARAEDISHGDPMKCAGRLHHGDGYLLAELRQDSPAPGHEGFHLHPARLDAATLAGLGQTQASGQEPFIPVYIAEFRAPRRLGAAFHVYAPRPESIAPSGDVITNDFGLYDERGHFVAGFGGLSCKRIRSPRLIERLLGDPGRPQPPATGRNGTGDLVGRLRELVAGPLGRPPGEVPTGTGFYDLGLDSVTLVDISERLEKIVGRRLYPTLLFEYGDIDSLAAHLSATYDVPPEPPEQGGTLCFRDVWVPLPQDGDDPGEYREITPGARYDGSRHLLIRATPGEPADPCLAVWETAKAVLAAKPERPVTLTYAHTGDDPAHEAVAALARTITAETPLIRCRSIRLDTAASEADALRDASAEPEIRYERGERLVRRWLPAEPSEGVGTVPVRTGGVYVIAGGTGGIGRLLAEHLERRHRARAVPVSRNAEISADLTDPDQVERALATVRERHGRIDGVFHCAGVNRDGLYPGKRAADIEAVVAAKALSVRHLDAATEDDDLDCFVVFSSVSASLANPGQADYAFANAYLEEFARRRAARGDRPGRTLAVAWPYWAEGGMRVGPETVEHSRTATGMVPLPTEVALDVLDRALSGTGDVLTVLHGDPGRIRDLLPVAPPQPAPRTSASVAGAEEREARRDEPRTRRDQPEARQDQPGARVEEPIAVVGLAGRYPQAPDLRAFWRNLAEGRDCIEEIPDGRWNHDEIYDPEKGARGRTYGKWGGFLDGVDRFDPAFFGISRRDAERMDPQERLFLQTCWHALEDAGHPPESLSEQSVGVFAGVMWNHYQLVEGGEGGVAPTAMHASIANRVSYTFDLHGPSIALDTACSSSLTAVHLAVESLRRGECDLALAGGVNATVHPQKYLQLAQGHWLSEDGRCRAFGAGGSGYVPGEGVGAVLLRPLSRARADGDHVYGVIAATAVNHTGRTSGATVPSPRSQAALIGTAIRRSGWDPASIGYIEAHGTGTSLGDPIEVEGMRQALPEDADCAIGSVKSNIGHLEGAAGIAGLTKVLLQLRHGRLVPSLHAEELNPKIDFDATPFHVQRALEPWTRAGGTPRRAGVSAFGAGGTNAHVLVEEAPEPVPAPGAHGPCLFVLSARTPEALRDYARAWAGFLAEPDSPGFPPETDSLGVLAGSGSPGFPPEARSRGGAERVAALLGIPADQLDPADSLGDLGLDPAALIQLGQGLSLHDTVADLADTVPDPADTVPDPADTVPDPAGPGVGLADLAYTSQVGRTGMAERLALVVDDVAALRAGLEAYARGANPGPGAFTGSGGGDDGEGDGTPSEDDCVRLFRAGRLEEVAAAWARGAEVPWRACHDGGRLVPAPVYPFQEESCWLGRWQRAVEPPVETPDEGDVELVPDGEGVRFEVLPEGVALVVMGSGASMFTRELIDDLQAAFAEIAGREDVKAVVLTGSGNVFSMGATPEALRTLAGGEGRFTDVPFLYEGLLRCDRPVIAAVQGHASGGGLAFGLFADLVIMAAEGVYSANFMKFGFTPGMGATYILEERLGRSAAHEMLYTGRSVTGEELARRGAGVTVLPQGAVLKAALRHARSIAALPLPALRALKSELAGRVLDRLPGVIAGESGMHERVLGKESLARVDDYFAKVDTFRGAPSETVPPEGASAEPAAREGGSAEPAAPEGGSRGGRSAPGRQEARPAVAGPEPAEVRRVIEGTLMSHLYLQAHEVDDALSFSEMGLDSIGAVEIVRDLNRGFGLDLDSVAVYDHPTVPALVEAVRDAVAADGLTVPPPRPAPEQEPPEERPLVPEQPAPSERAETPDRAGRVRLPSLDGDRAAPEPAAEEPPARTGTVTLEAVRPAEEPPAREEDIAVIGMAGRYPDAPDLQAFWRNLADGRCSIREVPPERFDVSRVYDTDRMAPGRTYSKWAAMLTDVDAFDAGFFNISPLEAETMDPQQRLFLQEAWHALEDAGYAGRSGRRPWGCFVGCGAGDYASLLAAAGRDDTGHAFLGNASSVLPARIAYLLDFGGPTMAVDTACSSSLVAVHLACESIRRGECEAAIAGGVAVMNTPRMHIWCSKAGMLSPTGTCAPFDESADGIVLGEGVGVVVLKRLDRALADGDHVHGVIRAGGVNGDGASNGITAPSASSQAELLAEVHRRAGIGPGEVDYVETHGTGTELGDPIEVKALAKVFGMDRERPCRIGSLKANVGHTTMAAGIGGLLKTLLALRHRQLPPSPGFTRANPKIDFADGALEVVTELSPWTAGGSRKRVAAVSSFGFSGTNCHVVVAEAPSREPRTGGREDVVVPLSASDEQTLARLRTGLAAHLDAHPDLDVRDVARTLAVGRPHLAGARCAYVAGDLADLRGQLRDGPRPARGEAGRLAERYTGGGDLPWDDLTAGGRRVPLPGHPFAHDQRHWIGRDGRDGHPARPAQDAWIRPDDRLVADHRIGGTPVLPGVAFLTIAAERAGLSGPVRFERVRWLRPFEVREARPLDVVVHDDGGVELDGHARGTLRPGDGALRTGDSELRTGDSELRTGEGALRRLDVAAIEARCAGSRPADDLYRAFDRAGLHYGPGFRVLREVRVGDGEALGVLRDGARWEALLDGALQTVAALRPEDGEPAMPFSVESAELDGPVTGPSYAHVTDEGRDGYTVRLADAAGQVRAEFRGVVLRTRPARPTVAGMTFAPVWHRTRPAVASQDGGGRALVLHTPAAEPLARALLDAHEDGRLAPLAAPPEGRYDTVYVLAVTGQDGPPADDPTTHDVFRLVKRLSEQGRSGWTPTVKVVVAGAVRVGDEEIVPHAAGVIGLTRAVAAEHPHWTVVTIDVGAAPPPPADLARLLRAESCADELVALRDGHRHIRTLEPLALPLEGGGPYRDGGAYLIVGGTGGLGRTLSRHLAATVGARLALVGRREITPEIREQLAEIESLGGRAVYLRADVADRAAFGRAVEAARQRFGEIHGAFHAALVLRDMTLANMDDDAFTQVLAPKVAGAAVFAEALAGLPLDFLAYFSSAASFVEVGGQANYAAAGTFEDAYALSLRDRPVSVINWGYWGSVGAVSGGGYDGRFAELGIGSIEPEEGMAVLASVLRAGARQALVVKADPKGLAHIGIHIPDIPPESGRTGGRGELERARVAFGELDELARGLLRRSADRVRAVGNVREDRRRLHAAVLDLLDGPAREPSPEEVLARFPDLEPHVKLLTACVEALPGVLAGERDPMEVLFPGGSMSLVEQVYKGQAVSDHFNRLLAEEVARGGPRRVLEIGAGTGAGTGFVLDALEGRDVEYTYTDISAGFLRHGEREFAGRRPDLVLALLDVERDPSEQGFETGAYDVVLATNVLHATADVGRTLRNAAALLRPGGRLLVNEVTRAADFLTLTFGLTPGWWRFTDEELRLPHSPLLGAVQWQRAFRAAGLTPARTLGIPGTPVEELDQCVLVGETASAGGARDYVKRVFAEVLKYGTTDLDERATFETFGIDSLVSQNVIHRFEQDLGPLPSTLLFENLTIEELAAYLQSEHGGRLRAALGQEPVREEPARAAPRREPVSRALDIAVVAVTGRYPASPDLDAFWSNLAKGANCITEADRFDLDALYDPKRGRKQRTYSKWGGFIEGVEQFDAPFFGILPRDAEITDPQERLFLETAWTLLEDAGYLSEHTRQPSTGVFVGTMYGSYGRMAAAEGWPDGRYAGAHSAYWSIANRVSYFFDLRGPSLAVDSACSSSLTAVQLACESLRRGECAQAVAGGVNLILHPAHFVALCSLNMLAADGACKVFDEAADGFVPGEGVGAVLLKPLADAEADGDRIYGVIKGAFANAGGKTAGYTVPNPGAQADLVSEAVRRAGLDPRTISYVEAHGTGTALGDPIEIASLTRAFALQGAVDGDRVDRMVGSVKANIGHLEGAAGIAGLTKVLLQFQHGQVAPCANLETPNSKIDFAASPFRPPDRLTDWQRPFLDGETFPRRAGVSSFGAGGANVHVVLEEYVPTAGTPPEPADEGEQVILLSARTRDQLRAMAGGVADVAASGRAGLAELAYTTQVGRAELPERLAVRAATLDELAARLRSFAGDCEAEGVLVGTADPGAGQAPPEDGAEGLGAGWVAGVRVDWAANWPTPHPRRVTLPPYPFDRRPYWLPTTATTPTTHPTDQTSGDPTNQISGDAAGKPTDQPGTTPRPPALQPTPADAAAAPQAGSELATEPASGQGPRNEAVGREAADGRCTYLRPRWTPAALPEGPREPEALLVITDDDQLAGALGGTRLRPGDAFPADDPSEQAARQLGGLDRTPDAIVIAPSDPFPGTAAFDVLLRTATAVLRDGGPLRVVVSAATGEPHHTALAAALRTLALEHTGFSGVCVTGATPAQVAAELRAPAAGSAPEQRVSEVAYRDGVRLLKGMEPYEPPAPGLDVRPDGTYLITGGAGAIGLAFARFLAGRGAARLILTGRSDPGDDIARRIAGLPAVYVRADVCSAADLCDLRDRYGPFHGVIHAAGIHRDARAVGKRPEDTRAVLGPKVLGTVLLDEALRGQPLDFLALFSSVAAETGNIGQIDYAYANAFLNHFAERRERLGHGRTLAVGWPLWEEGGMKVDDATRRLFERRWGSVPMSTAAGLTAFARGLAGAETSFAVVEGPSAPAPERSQPPATPESEVMEMSEPMSAPETTGPGDDLIEAVRGELRRAAAGFLLVGEEHVDLDAELMDMGFDSISMAELVDQVNERYKLDLLPTVLFEATDLATFCDHLLAEHPAELAAVHTPTSPSAKPAGEPLAAPAGRREDAEPGPAPETVNSPPRPGAGTSPTTTAGTATSNPATTGTATSAPATGGVAIVGMAGVFPGSTDLDDFWRHLAEGHDLTRPVPDDRRELRENPETANVRAGFLDDVRSFDAALFGISPKEAAMMDPQQRLFLQTVWRAVEDAGHRPSDLAGTRTGLFAGVSACDYDDLLREHGVPVEAHTASGVADCILANRVSHLLDLRGPSEAVDTACSSSLVALHHAVRAIEDGECEAAIAGGVNLTLSPGLYIAFAKSGMISEDGVCKTFDERADGYGRGEGCGAVLLKPLRTALEDGDQILAVIRGSAVNHGGRASSLTAPNPEAQARVLVDAYRKADVDPARVTYIEAHGTGTRLGDPIEIEGMKKAFARLYADRGRPVPDVPHVALATVKTNIGHLEAAAGIAGLLKVLLCMRHGALPPTIHYERPNPYVRLEGSPFTVNTRLTPWDGADRVAGVSSFGFGGTNAHVVLEAYRQQIPAGTAGEPRLLVLSAARREALEEYAQDVARYIREHPEIDLDRIAWTLQNGRRHLAERLAVVVRDREQAVRALSGEPAGAHRGTARKDAPAPWGTGLEDLAEAWVSGSEVDWQGLWQGPRPVRVSLPGPPFARVEHWFTAPEPSRAAAPAAVSSAVPSAAPSDSGVVRRTSEGKVRLRAAKGGRTPDASAPAGRAEAARPDETPVAPAGSAGGPAGVEEMLRERLSTILDADPAGVDVDTPFEELGLDSIFRMELVKAINAAFSLDLQAAELYEYDTVDRLARAVESAITESTTPTPTPKPEPTRPKTPEPARPEAPHTARGKAADLEDRLAELVGVITERPLDTSRSFTDNGLTSFEMLRVVNVLEKQVGALRKTLLFDHPTLADLAAHLRDERGVESVRLPEEPDGRPATHETRARDGEPAVLLKRDLHRHPDLRDLVAGIDRRHAKEGGLAGRDIAPLAFVGSARKGYLHVSENAGNLLAWSYAGSEEYFHELVEEYTAYAKARGLRPNFLSLLPVREVGGEPYSATPFGAVQRLEDLGSFTLKGGRMERLRYMVRRFCKAGECRTAEYRSGEDPAMDRRLAGLVDEWAGRKQMVNPYVSVVRREIEEGRLDRRHRVFVTYLDDEVANAVVITKIPSENGYLLDVEFYPKGMPLGGLEFAIVRIIEQLVDEGCTMFSFGASFGVETEESANAAPDVRQALDELRSAGIFGEGNFQFKNKFRPVNVPIYLCQPEGEDRTPVSEIILMIADPDLRPATGADPTPDDQTDPDPTDESPPDEKPADTKPARDELLARYGGEPARVPAHHVSTDLITDSWAELDAPWIAERLRRLTERSAARPDTEIKGLPFPFVVPTGSGRAAEALLCRSRPGRPGRVLHNGLFPTWFLNLGDNGFKPVELPGGPEVDVEALRAELAGEEPVSFVCVEVGNNAAGGAPTSLANLRAVKEAAARYGVPLVVDGARVVDNAVAVADGRDVWEVVREILALADSATISLSKDFGVPFGGLLATRDDALRERVAERLETWGRDVGLANRRIIAAALEDRETVAEQVRARGDAVAALRQGLSEAGVPLEGPPGGHCVLLKDADHVRIFRKTGIRGAPHFGREGVVRLAVPVGLSVEEAKDAAARLATLLTPDTPTARPTRRRSPDTPSARPARRTTPDTPTPRPARGGARDNPNLAILREHNPDVEHEIVTTRDGDVELFAAGSGPPLLLMHPFNIGAGVYARQFEGLAHRYRVTSVHHPGVGATTAAADLSLGGLARLCHDVAGGPAHVAGASFGGLVALTYALDHPDDTESLILIGSSCRIGNRVGDIDKLEVVATQDFDRVVEGSGSKRLRKRRDGLMRLLLRAESMAPQVGLRYLDVFAERPDLGDRLAEIRARTLIVQGRYDTVIPAKTAHLLHALIPDSRYEEIPDAGHFPQLTSPDHVNRLICEFHDEQN
ncbi:SDR family NAD(P)-dependent oxidoreductase [Nonomuraea sp. NPDC052265]|uniref:SDR family NAD(P)-dependent oxidoreductase n=1 Tax=Nonomuraea sp. NPDC052265 TaxID=3364374 RepID=UPI0037C784F1